MAVAKHHLVDDLLKELADLPTASNPVECTTANFASTSSSQAAMPSPQAIARMPDVVQQQHQKQQQQWHQQRQADDLDSLLRELREDSLLSQQMQSSKARSEGPDYTGRSAASSLSGGTSARLKCSSIYLGGSKGSRGCCQPMQPAPCCCDRLKCLSCDFQVLWHADACWAADVDYMFFRNVYGMAARLATKLRPCRGSAAMCCQCSWASCSQATKLADAAQEAGHSLRWICRGHEYCACA